MTICDRFAGGSANRMVITMIAFGMLAGCGKGGSAAADATPSASSHPGSSAVAEAATRNTALPAMGEPQKVEAQTDAYQFAYAYPARADAIRPLKRVLDGERDAMKAELIAEATSGQADARKNGYPYRAYSNDKAWSVVTDTPGWLSLSATIASYSGGAHGMMVFDTLLWDKQAGRRRNPLDLFASKAAFRAAVAKPLCAALDRERLKRRGGEASTAGDQFSQCIDPIDDTTVILGSSDRLHFDRIGFLVPPYNAGPYAEGVYELTLPVGPALLAAVKPAFRSAFAVR